MRKQLYIVLLFCGMMLHAVACSHVGSQNGEKEQSVTSSIEQMPALDEAIIRFVPEPAEHPEPTTEGVLIDTQDAWIKSKAGILRTTDGGQKWERFGLSPRDEAVFGRMAELSSTAEFVTVARGWLSSVSGTWQTDDGGQTWRRIFANRAIGPQFTDKQNGWMSVATSSGQESYVTRDGGQTWRPCGPKVGYDKQTPAGKPHFLTQRLGWAITTQTIGGMSIFGVARTNDGGCHWQQVWIGNGFGDKDPDERYGDIFFISEREGWLAGDYLGSLYHTANGGKTWQKVRLPVDDLTVVSVYFENSNEGWIIGGHQSMPPEDTGEYRTTDGGKTWRQLTETEIINGFGENSSHVEIPRKWKAGRLFQMLLRSKHG